MEQLGSPAETLDLTFTDVSAIYDLRDRQNEALYQAGVEALEKASLTDISQDHHIVEKARDAKSATFDDMCDAYLTQHLDKDTHPELYTRLSDMLKSVSVHNMSSEKWNLGDRDADGNYDYKTSGRYMVEQTMKELTEQQSTDPPEEDDDSEDDDPPSDTPEAPDPAEVTKAEQALTKARDELAKLSVARRRKARQGGQKGTALQRRYEKALEAYNNARNELGVLRVQEWRSSGTADETTLRKNVIDYTLDEHQSFTKAEATNLTEDPSRRARIVRFMARHKWAFFGASAGAGFGIGYGLGRAAKAVKWTAVGLGGAAALPAAIAGGAAIKTTKAVLQSSFGNHVHLVRSHDKRAQQDYDSLQGALDERLADVDQHEDMLKNSHSLLVDHINTRVRKDVNSNRNRVIAAAAIGGTAGVLGGIAAEHGFSALIGHHTHHPNTVTGDSGQFATNTVPHQPDAAVNTDIGPRPGAVPVHHSVPLAGNENQPATVDGFSTNVVVENGHGYTTELQELAAQKGIHLSGQDSWKLYQHLNNQFHGKFFNNDPSYLRSQGDWGISRAGQAQWNAHVIQAMNQWLIENSKETTKN